MPDQLTIVYKLLSTVALLILVIDWELIIIATISYLRELRNK